MTSIPYAVLGDHLPAANHVVGHAEDVEAATAVQVDHLPERQTAVAPGRVGMELAQKQRLHAREWRACHVSIVTPATRPRGVAPVHVSRRSGERRDRPRSNDAFR
jgi:hypothetical protein